MPNTTAHNTLSVCIYAKPPLAGRTKSRLAQEIGAEPAAALSRALLEDIIALCYSLSDCEVSIYYPPDAIVSEYAHVQTPAQLRFVQQEGATLGERMYRTMKAELERRTQCCIIGSDCASFSPEVYRELRQALNENDVVIQPAHDGGYTLIGMSQPHEAIFSDIAWGSVAVFEQTCERAQESGLRLHSLVPGYDIDVVEDLNVLQKAEIGLILPRAARWYAQASGCF